MAIQYNFVTMSMCYFECLLFYIYLMNTKILKNFGENVRRKRRLKDFSQEQLAEKLGIHRTYMSFIERGLRNPSLLMIFKISRVLKIKLPELFDFDE